MTRGRMYLITDNEIYYTTEFNGDMYPDGKGFDAIKILTKTENENENKDWLFDFMDAIEEFDKNHFGYAEEGYTLAYHSEYKEIDFSVEYFKNYGSDYIYIKNISGGSKNLIDRNGKKKEILPDEIKIFYFGREKDVSEYLEKIKEEKDKKAKDVSKYLDKIKNGENKKWQKIEGFTGGGDPCYMCPVCNDVRSEHINGIEQRKDWKYCPYCGTRLDY